MTFFDTAVQYLEKEKYNLSSSTVRTYYWNLRKISDFKPGLDCADLTTSIIQEYKAYMIQRGNKLITVNKALTVFRIFVNKIYEDGLIKVNPFDKIKIGRVYTQRSFLT